MEAERQGNGIRRGRKPAATPRMIRAGVLLAGGKARSTGEALVRVGYAPATARNPGQNGLSPARLLREAVAAGGGGNRDELVSLRRPALAVLRELLTDPEQSPGVRAPAALGVLKLVEEYGGFEGDGVADLNRVRVVLAVRLLAAFAAGVRLAGHATVPGRVNARRRELTALLEALHGANGEGTRLPPSLS